jgi:hypothetical protein
MKLAVVNFILFVRSWPLLLVLVLLICHIINTSHTTNIEACEREQEGRNWWIIHSICFAYEVGRAFVADSASCERQTKVLQIASRRICWSMNETIFLPFVNEFENVFETLVRTIRGNKHFTLLSSSTIRLLTRMKPKPLDENNESNNFILGANQSTNSSWTCVKRCWTFRSNVKFRGIVREAEKEENSR